MKALIIHTQGGLGDLLLSSPIATALRRTHADCEVYVWAHSRFSEILLHHPDIQGVFDFPVETPILKVAAELRRRRFDIAVLPWSKSRQAWMVRLAGIPIRAGQGGRLSYSFLFTHPVNVRSQAGDTTSHWVDIQLDYARALNCMTEDLKPQVVLLDAELRAADEQLAAFGLPPDRPIVALQICKGQDLNSVRWPLDLFVNVGRKLIDAGYAVILTGIASERNLTAETKELIDSPFVINAAGTGTLRQTAALIARSAVTICPDTGPGHLAAALGIPVVAVFARNCDIAARWRPYGEEHRVVVPKPATCRRDCTAAPCPRATCLLEVDPDEVVAAACEIALIKPIHQQ